MQPRNIIGYGIRPQPQHRQPRYDSGFVWGVLLAVSGFAVGLGVMLLRGK